MKITKLMNPLKGEIELPSDKSISHRAVMFGSIAKGKTIIHRLLLSADVKTTLSAFQKMGVKMKFVGDDLEIEGSNFHLTQPRTSLDFGNSGTTARLLMGILASQNFETHLVGDESLLKRPMNRVAIPLSLMGADVRAQGSQATLPVTIKGGHLNPINYEIPVASAQVKTSLIFAALRAQGKSHFIEQLQTRDHTERMLPLFGGKIEVKDLEIKVSGPQNLFGTTLTVPGDFSSASFWIVATLIVPGSELLLKKVGVNPTRTGLLDIVKTMGAKIELLNFDHSHETADIHVTYTGDLRGIEISGELIPRCIDELPILSLLATQATGETVIKNAKELRFKESDRISSVTSLLKSMGADITPYEDGMIIVGKTDLSSSEVEANKDHRLMMTAVIAGLIAENGNNLPDNIEEIISTSYPTFFEDLRKICQ